MDSPMWLEISILLILVLVNAFFASSEIAIISLNDQKIKKMAEEGHKQASILLKLIQEPSQFLATIQVGVTLSGFLASAFAANSFSARLTDWAIKQGVTMSPSLLNTTSLIIITLLLSYLTLVFGELVPKRLAMQKPEPISMFVARPLHITAKITKPFVHFLSFSTNTVIRLLGGNPHADEETITEEEIRMMVDVGEEKGVIQGSEKTMISNVLSFDDKTVSDVMTHRTSVISIPVTTTIQEAMELFIYEKYTRIPVYEDNIDRIIGILHIKDLLPCLNKEHVLLNDIIRKPYFILESASTSQAFGELQKQSTHMAIVVDEYGGTEGLVTLEDLLEEIVGNIQDEHDEHEELDITKVEEGTFYILGSTPIYDVNNQLKISLSDDTYDTIGGYMMGELGKVIEDNEHLSLSIEPYEFTVIDSSDNRIVKIRATLKRIETVLNEKE